MFVICRSSHLVPWYLLAHISKVADTLKVSHMQNEERKTRKMRFESEKKCLLVYRSTGLRGWQAAAVNELRFFLHDLNSTVALLILSNCPELSECNFPVHCIWRREICRFWHEIMTFYILLLFSLDMHKFSMVHSRCKSANVSRKSFVYLFPTRTWIYAYELPKYCSPIWKGVENVFRTFWCFCLNEWKTLNSRTFLVKKSQTITWQLNNCDSIGRECIECIALFYGHCNVTSAGGFTQTQFSHSWWKIKSPINFKINLFAFTYRREMVRSCEKQQMKYMLSLFNVLQSGQRATIRKMLIWWNFRPPPYRGEGHTIFIWKFSSSSSEKHILCIM